MSSISRKRSQKFEQETNSDDEAPKAEKVSPRAPSKPPKPNFTKIAGSRDALRTSVEDTGAFMLLLILDITKMVLQLMKQPM